MTEQYKMKKQATFVEAVQWHKNGDHPRDNCIRIADDILGEHDSEGAFVRYFRRPDIEGHKRCARCGHIMHEHGWIDVADAVVHPSDYVVQLADGSYSVLPQTLFSSLYEKATYADRLVDDGGTRSHRVG